MCALGGWPRSSHVAGVLHLGAAAAVAASLSAAGVSAAALVKMEVDMFAAMAGGSVDLGMGPVMQPGVWVPGALVGDVLPDADVGCSGMPAGAGPAGLQVPPPMGAAAYGQMTEPAWQVQVVHMAVHGLHVTVQEVAAAA
jgi:hypothetical protein